MVSLSENCDRSEEEKGDCHENESEDRIAAKSSYHAVKSVARLMSTIERSSG